MTKIEDHQKNRGDDLLIPDIIDRIRMNKDNITKSQRALAEYIIQHPEHVGLLTISELANNVGVSDATVVRFCNSQGYKGYSELGKVMQRAIRYELSTIGRFNLAQERVWQKDKPGGSVFEHVVSTELENIRRMAESVSKADFYLAVEWLEEADHVVIVGAMGSESLSRYFHYAAAKILPSVKLVNSLGASDSDFLKLLTRQSLVILLAFPRYPKTTLQVGQIAKETGCRVVSITDSHHSPVVQVSGLVLQVSVSVNSIVDAYAAPTILINALVSELSERHPEKTERSLSYFEKFAKEMNIWCKPMTRSANASLSYNASPFKSNKKEEL